MDFEILENLPETVSETSVSISTDSLIDLNKAYMGKIVDSVMERVLDGHTDEVRVLVLAKKGQELYKQLEERIRPVAEEKVRLAKGEIYRTFDTEIKQQETGVKYDYSKCNDPQWERLNASAEAANKALKAREETLKTLTSPVDVLDPETGEVTTVKPPVRSGKTGLAVSIK